MPMGGAQNPYSLGYIPDLADDRDQFLFSLEDSKNLDAVKIGRRGDVSRVAAFPRLPVQGRLGSCVTHGIGTALMFDQAKQHLFVFLESRLWLYYEGRKLLNTINSDSGMVIRDGLKIVAGQGFPEERFWPYDITKFTQEPPLAAYTAAALHAAVSFKRVRSLLEVKQAITMGFPVITGFTCFRSIFSSAVTRSGEVPDPIPGDSSAGGHCTLIKGFDDDARGEAGAIGFANWWGREWGNNGFGTMSYDYWEKFARDSWVVYSVR